jgi:hypothetical protein
MVIRMSNSKDTKSCVLPLRGEDSASSHLLRLPRGLQSRIAEAASAAEVSKNDIIVKVLAQAFPDTTRLE